MRGEVSPDDLVKRDSVGAGQLDGSIQRLLDGDSRHGGGEVIRENWLKQRRGQVDGVPGGRRISDARNELKKLRGADNRVRNWRSLDQFFL